MSTYKPRPAAEVTTDDLIATIRADRDEVATFEARAEFTKRTRDSWRTFAPARPRTSVTCDGGAPIQWVNFVESGEL